MSATARKRKPRRGRRQGQASSHDPRIAAVQVMMDIVANAGSFRDRLPVAQQALAAGDRARCQAWCYGLARFHVLLADRLAALLDKPLKARDADLGWLLELGLYQLEHSELPAPLVVSETVEAVEGLDKSWARGLVNAVLRRSLREPPMAPASAATALACPTWLYEHIQADWGDRAEAIAEASNQQGPMTVRVARGPDGMEAAHAAFADAGIPVTVGQRAAAALVLTHPVDVAQLPGFERGELTVQDESAQLAVEFLGAVSASGGRLLDACAAPGGKTVQALDGGRFTEVVALDVSASRLERLGVNLRRLESSDTASLVCADAADVDSWWDGRPFDAVLLDAPCSGSGVIRRHPDIKLLRRASDLDALIATQARLLDAAWQVLAPGGWLMYATCSIFKCENETQVLRFLERHGDARAETLPARAGEARPHDGAQHSVGRQWLTDGEFDGDGFWYSLLQRSATDGDTER